jgi:hypothetical protein
MTGREKAAKAGPETRTVTYLAPGVAPDLTPGTPTLDPELEKIRDREIEKLAEVVIDVAPKEATLDPALVEARENEIKRERQRAGLDVKASEPASETPAKTAPAKKAAAKKSSK